MNSTATRPNTVAVTGENFGQEVLESGAPTLLYFWATWCIPCNLMKRAIGKAAETLEGKAKVAMINVDQAPDLLEKFGVRGTPTFILVKGEQVLDQFSGITTTGNIVARVKAKA